MAGYGRDYRRVWMGGGGLDDGDSDVEYGSSAGGFHQRGRGGRYPGGSWGGGRYAADYGRRPGYGYGFRRGYELRGGFGYAGERRGGGFGSRRWLYDEPYRPAGAMRAWPGEMRVSRWHGRGYGRG